MFLVEHFLGFTNVENVTRENLIGTIIQFLKINNLDIYIFEAKNMKK